MNLITKYKKLKFNAIKLDSFITNKSIIIAEK